MRKVVFEEGKFYHIYNRGIEKRTVFSDPRDYCRFLFQVFACNIGKPAIAIFRKEIISAAKAILEGKEIKNKRSLIAGEHPPLVDIIAFVLMPNHFHLILRERTTRGGISKFMQKLGTAYTMYFNLRNTRSGSLFQGNFKAILIENERYLFALLRYLHLNPVELVEPNFKEKIKDLKKVYNFLKDYQWSSHLDYLGLRNSTLIQKDIPESFLKHYKEFIAETLKEKNIIKKELKSIKFLIFE